MYSRTDYFDCHHSYTVDESGRNKKITTCPICERDFPTQVGKYIYSKVMDDTPDPPKHRVQGVDFGNGRTVEVRPNPDGTFGTPLIQPNFGSLYSSVAPAYQSSSAMGSTVYYDIETNGSSIASGSAANTVPYIEPGMAPPPNGGDWRLEEPLPPVHCSHGHWSVNMDWCPDCMRTREQVLEQEQNEREARDSSQNL